MHSGGCWREWREGPRVNLCVSVNAGGTGLLCVNVLGQSVAISDCCCLPYHYYGGNYVQHQTRLNKKCMDFVCDYIIRFLEAAFCRLTSSHPYLFVLLVCFCEYCWDWGLGGIEALV